MHQSNSFESSFDVYRYLNYFKSIGESFAYEFKTPGDFIVFDAIYPHMNPTEVNTFDIIEYCSYNLKFECSDAAIATKIEKIECLKYFLVDTMVSYFYLMFTWFRLRFAKKRSVRRFQNSSNFYVDGNNSALLKYC